jgi:hypothetical protein
MNKKGGSVGLPFLFGFHSFIGLHPILIDTALSGLSFFLNVKMRQIKSKSPERAVSDRMG